MLEKLKRINIKYVVKSFTMIWGLVLIILMTITNVGLNKEFNWITWISNSLIIFMIMVFGLLMGESSGKDKQLTKEDGLYQITKEEYEKTHALVEGELPYFPQYYYIEREEEYFHKKLDHITQSNISEEQARLILKYCQKDDIEKLKLEPLEFEGNVIRKITDEEVIEVIMDVFEGRVKFQPESIQYFLTLNALNENIGTLEVGGKLNKSIKRNRATNRTVKIVSQFAVSLIWGLLTVYDFISGEDTQAWVNLVSRITALFTSFFSGYLSAVIEVKLEAEKIKNKVVVLTAFHNALHKKMFIPKLESELAREEYLKSIEAKVVKEEAKEQEPEIKEEPIIEEMKGELENGNLNEQK